MSQLDAFDYVIEGPDRSLQAFKYIVSIWSETPPSFFYTTLGIGEKESFFGYKFFYCMSQETIAHITLQVKGCQYVERFVFIINALFTYSSGCECEELTIQNWKYVCYMKYVFNLLSNDVRCFFCRRDYRDVIFLHDQIYLLSLIHLIGTRLKFFPSK